MKIVLATPVYPPEIGGPATYTKELCERWEDEHDITIVAYANTVEKIPGTKLIAVEKRWPLPVRLALFTWRLFGAAQKADVIYVQNAVAAGLPAALVGTLLHKPVVLKFVGDEAWERATQLKYTSKQLEDFLTSPEGPLRIRLMMSLQGWVLRHMQAVTTPSAYLARAIIHAYKIPEKRVVVNYNAAEKTESLPFEGTKKQHQIVATARLVEWKGIDGIIRAVKLLVPKYPDVHALIAGDGPDESKLKALATELDIADHVTFLGRVSRAETWHIRKESEVYVLNSTYEGLPHTALTSFSAEIPMVATDIPGTNEAVYNNETGLLVPVGDDEALAHAIARLFEDASLRAELTTNATKLLAEKFSWQAHLSTLRGLLDSVCSNPVH